MSTLNITVQCQCVNCGKFAEKEPTHEYQQGSILHTDDGCVHCGCPIWEVISQ